jgi:transposase
VRGRLTVRDALVRTRTSYIAVVRSLLRQHGWRVLSGGAEAFIQRVVELPLPGRLLSELGPLLAVLRPVNQQLAYSDERIEAATRTDSRVRLRRSMPSVGPVTAAAFVSAIDDVRRFRRAREVAAYLGLVPRELSSGEHQRRGRITKAGHTRVWWLLVQAAVSIVRLRSTDGGPAGMGDGDHRSSWEEGGSGSVALARRLAGILFAMLRDGRAYEPRPKTRRATRSGAPREEEHAGPRGG